MYSQTYIAVIVNVLVILLPKLGVTIGSEELTTTIQVILGIGTAIWILVRRYKQGGVTMAGVRKW